MVFLIAKFSFSVVIMKNFESTPTFLHSGYMPCPSQSSRKPTGKRPLGRPRRRWEDNIRMDLEEIGIYVGNWVDSAQYRNYWRALVNAALNLRVP